MKKTIFVMLAAVAVLLESGAMMTAETRRFYHYGESLSVRSNGESSSVSSRSESDQSASEWWKITVFRCNTSPEISFRKWLRKGGLPDCPCLSLEYEREIDDLGYIAISGMGEEREEIEITKGKTYRGILAICSLVIFITDSDDVIADKLKAAFGCDVDVETSSPACCALSACCSLV